MIRHYRRALSLLIVAVLASACGSQAEETVRSAGANEISVSATDLVMCSKEERATAGGDVVPIFDDFYGVASWVQIVSVENAADVRSKGRGLGKVEARILDSGRPGDIQQLEMRFARDTAIAVSNALRSNDVASVFAGGNPGDASIPSGYGRISVLIVEFADGSSALIGGCRALDQSKVVEGEHGPELLGFAGSATQLVGEELAAFALGKEESPTDRPVLLNPETIPEGLSETLRSVLVFYAVDGAVEDRTVCGKAQAGWNDCISLASGEGIVLPAYVSADGKLEFFVFDGIANVDSPISSLGTVVFDARTLAGPNPAVRVDINSQNIDAEQFTKAMTVGRQANFTQEMEEDPYWSVEERTAR